MEVLEREDMESIISWLPHGRAFIVLQPQQLRDIVLPRFFKQTKFMSFTRQLNLWGFKRMTKGLDSGAYYHSLFLRGRRRLAMLMRRQKIKGTGIKLTPSPDTEPNFYKISEKSPLPATDPSKKEKKPLPPLLQRIPSRAILDTQISGYECDQLSVNARNAGQFSRGRFDQQIYPFGLVTEGVNMSPGAIGDNFSMPLLHTSQQLQGQSNADEFVNFLRQKALLDQQHEQEQLLHADNMMASRERFYHSFEMPSENRQLQELRQRLYVAAQHSREVQPPLQHQQLLMHQQQSNPLSSLAPSSLSSELMMLQQQQRHQQQQSENNDIAALMSSIESTRNSAAASQARLEELNRELQLVRFRRSL
jgi:hypothetical protein